jgi:hypothetical protein
MTSKKASSPIWEPAFFNVREDKMRVQGAKRVQPGKRLAPKSLAPTKFFYYTFLMENVLIISRESTKVINKNKEGGKYGTAK